MFVGSEPKVVEIGYEHFVEVNTFTPTDDRYRYQHDTHVLREADDAVALFKQASFKVELTVDICAEDDGAVQPSTLARVLQQPGSFVGLIAEYSVLAVTVEHPETMGPFYREPSTGFINPTNQSRQTQVLSDDEQRLNERLWWATDRRDTSGVFTVAPREIIYQYGRTNLTIPQYTQDWLWAAARTDEINEHELDRLQFGAEQETELLRLAELHPSAYPNTTLQQISQLPPPLSVRAI